MHSEAVWAHHKDPLNAGLAEVVAAGGGERLVEDTTAQLAVELPEGALMVRHLQSITVLTDTSDEPKACGIGLEQTNY